MLGRSWLLARSKLSTAEHPGRLHRRPPSNGPMNLPVAFGRPQVIGRTFDSRKDR